MKHYFVLSLLFSIAYLASTAQSDVANCINVGTDRHNFFYSGESKTQYVYKIKDGKKIWEYTNPQGRGEISDIVPMSDGNILIAHQHGLKEINANGEIVWAMNAPEGCEIHTAQPIGLNKVVFVQNGDPLKVVVIETPSLKILREFEIPYLKPASVHGQVRNCCLTKDGTLIVALMQMKQVMEFDCNGNILNKWPFPTEAWGVCELDNRNILITGSKGLVAEINRSGETVWNFQLEKSDRYPTINTQKSYRLKNGNTVITNWFNEWRGTVDRNNPPIQAIEVTPDKRIVWELCSWTNPLDLGPATTFIPLDEPIDRCSLYFGDFAPSDAEKQLNAWNMQRKPRMHAGTNEPLGDGKGVYPGRVAWIHSPNFRFMA